MLGSWSITTGTQSGISRKHCGRSPMVLVSTLARKMVGPPTRKSGTWTATKYESYWHSSKFRYKLCKATPDEVALAIVQGCTLEIATPKLSLGRVLSIFFITQSPVIPVTDKPTNPVRQ